METGALPRTEAIKVLEVSGLRQIAGVTTVGQLSTLANDVMQVRLEVEARLSLAYNVNLKTMNRMN